jgi:cobalamin biosynthesis Mg chelatase CobN
MAFETNEKGEIEQVAAYHQATIIDAPETGKKPMLTKEPIHKRAVHTVISIKDKALEVTENGEAIRRAAASANSSIKKKAVETTEKASEMGEKYQEWLTVKNNERVERGKLRSEQAAERAQQEHEIRVTKTMLDLEWRRIKETGSALVDNEVRGIKDSSKIEREKIKAEERRTQEERKHELKVAKIEQKQFIIREKTERQKRRQTTLRIVGISFIIVIVLVLIVVVVLMPVVLRSAPPFM